MNGKERNVFLSLLLLLSCMAEEKSATTTSKSTIENKKTTDSLTTMHGLILERVKTFILVVIIFNKHISM